MRDLNVYDEVTGQDCYERYWSKKIKTVKLPSKVVLAKKIEHDGTKEWKAKARICACGNYEEGVGGDINNRSEVPSTFEMRTMLAMGEIQKWSIGGTRCKNSVLACKT